MSTVTMPGSRQEEEQWHVGSTTPIVRSDEEQLSAGSSYRRSVAVFASKNHQKLLKHFYVVSTSASSFPRETPYLEASEDAVGFPGATVASLIDWPSLWQHPERARTFGALVKLASKMDKLEANEWKQILESLELALQLNPAPQTRFRILATEWRQGTSFLSDTREICCHTSYLQIIGMGTLALPYIFAELEREVDHWFWALNAITREDPVPLAHRGDLAKMAEHWLNWAHHRKKKLTLKWIDAFVSSAAMNE